MGKYDQFGLSDEEGDAVVNASDRKTAIMQANTPDTGVKPYTYTAPPPNNSPTYTAMGHGERINAAGRGAQIGKALGDSVTAAIGAYKKNKAETQTRADAAKAIQQTQAGQNRVAALQDAADFKTNQLDPAHDVQASTGGMDAPVAGTQQLPSQDQPPAQAPQAPQSSPDFVAEPPVDADADATSDSRSKRDKARVRDMLDRAPAYTYEYKAGDQGEHAPPGKHFGVMAQDLEKSDVGRSMVRDDPQTGRKVVDYGQGLGAMMAGLSSLNDDVRKLKKGSRSK